MRSGTKTCQKSKKSYWLWHRAMWVSFDPLTLFCVALVLDRKPSLVNSVKNVYLLRITTFHSNILRALYSLTIHRSQKWYGTTIQTVWAYFGNSLRCLTWTNREEKNGIGYLFLRVLIFDSSHSYMCPVLSVVAQFCKFSFFLSRLNLVQNLDEKM